MAKVLVNKETTVEYKALEEISAILEKYDIEIAIGYNGTFRIHNNKNDRTTILSDLELEPQTVLPIQFEPKLIIVEEDW